MQHPKRLFEKRPRFIRYIENRTKRVLQSKKRVAKPKVCRRTKRMSQNQKGVTEPKGSLLWEISLGGYSVQWAGLVVTKGTVKVSQMILPTISQLCLGIVTSTTIR